MAGASLIPGGTVIATVPAGGASGANFYQQKALGLANAIGNAMNAARARREQKEERELAEIRQFYQLALSDSELAAAQGDWFAKKYGAKYPMLPPMIDALKDRDRLANDIRAGGDRFLDAQAGIENKYRRDMETLAAMPDEVPVSVPVPGFGGLSGGAVTLPIPNADKAVRSAQLSRVQPWAFQHLAASALSPRDRHLARLAKTYTQSEFDPFGDDVPQEQRALYAHAAGWLDEDSDMYRAARARNELEQSPADIAKQEYDTGERKGKESASLELEREQDRLMRGREEHRQGLERRRMAYGEEIDIRNDARQLAARRAGGKGKANEPLWQTAINNSAASVKEWQDGLDNAMKGVPNAPQRKDQTPQDVHVAQVTAKTSYVTQAGGRPARLSATNAQRIQSKVVAMGLPPEDARLETVKLVEEFTALTAGGAKTDEAMKVVLGRESSTMPASVRTLVGENEAATAKAQELHESGKSWADIEKLMRQAGAG